MLEILSDPTFQTVFLGTTLIGAVSGALGCLAYLRRQSLIGDVVAHSSLFGVVLFFLASYWITGEGTKSLFVLVPGAIFAGVVALWLNDWLLRTTPVREDSNLGVMLAIFFGSGLFLLRWVQRATPAIPGHRGLEGYIFGEAAAMTQSDLLAIGIMSGLSMTIVFLFWKELKVYSFDPVFSQSLGFRARWLELLLIVLLVLGIVVGIQAIGVVLMVAMLVTPPAAARQWTRSFGGMVLLSAVIGACSSGVGAYVSSVVTNLPTGPVIVLICIGMFLFSILFSPGRGILMSRVFRKHQVDQTRIAESSGKSLESGGA